MAILATDIGRVGIWSGPLRRGDAAQAADVAAELEDLGYGALWIPGGKDTGTLARATELLAATSRIPVATGIVNIWTEPAAEIATQFAEVEASHPGRLVLGVGISHGPLIGERYQRPYSAMVEYLDELDAASEPVAHERLLIAAIGPRMLALAAERTAGSHPYLVTPDHTRAARGILGDGPALAPEQTVVLETDPDVARAAARSWFEIYTGFPNYTRNLLRFGFEEEDLADGGSDRLIDAIVAWGDEDAIRARVQEHLDAGAGHVNVQVVDAGGEPFPREAWRRLAPALLG